MKKFSILLVGVFLLWTVTFVLADENSDAEVATWTTTEVTATETTETTQTEIVQPETAETTETEVTATETTEAEAAEWDTTETSDTETVEDNSIKISDAAREKYGEEQVTAYEWAFNNGITTINDIEKANLWGWLTRAQLAKMMSQYMTNVLWRTPATTEEKANYADVNESLGDLADFIETAYTYKIMWISSDGTPLKNFNPGGQVTRAEYATVFSRVLFGDTYNKTEWNYYENHIKALKSVWILTNDNPSIKEIRGWVMLMMYRSVSADLSNPVVEEDNPSEEATQEPTEEKAEPVIWMPNPAAVYCEQQGWTITIVKDEEWNESGMCKLADGTEIDEWEYYRANNPEETTETATPLYSEEDLNLAKSVITETVNGWNVKVESFNVDYAGDEVATSNLEYCKSLNPDATACAVFTSSFHIPEQDAQMAGAFEPNADISGYSWTLGKNAAGEWEVLSNGFG